jgi:hypothetical protein
MKTVSFVQVNVIPPHLHPALSFWDYASLSLYAGALLFEIIADRQKAAWRRAQENKEHEEKFITSGLWSMSRHPKSHFRFLIESGPRSDDSFLAMSAKYAYGREFGRSRWHRSRPLTIPREPLL